MTNGKRKPIQTGSKEVSTEALDQDARSSHIEGLIKFYRNLQEKVCLWCKRMGWMSGAEFRVEL